MLKNILNLEGAVELTINEKKSIIGGRACGVNAPACPAGTHCDYISEDGQSGICVKD